MSHCCEISQERVQVKIRTCSFVSLRVQFHSHTQVFHLNKGKQNGHLNLGGTWRNCWKMDDATLPCRSELANTKDTSQRQKSRRDIAMPHMLFECFDCHSWSNRPCATQPPGFHTTAREPKRAQLRVQAFKNTTKIQREDSQRETKRAKKWGGRVEKCEILGGSAEGVQERGVSPGEAKEK